MEMSKWWLHNTKDLMAFNADDKLHIEDLTGCIPLLLVPFLGHLGKTLESLEPQIWADEILASVVTSTIAFGRKQINDPLFKL
jgi:hypothetical protein